jgi:hypothetical protein
MRLLFYKQLIWMSVETYLVALLTLFAVLSSLLLFSFYVCPHILILSKVRRLLPLYCDSFTILNETGSYWKHEYALLFIIKSL